MQGQPTGSKSPEIHKVQQTSPTTASASTHVKHSSEGSSNRSSTSSWFAKSSLSFLRHSSTYCRSEEPVAPVNMDIMTGHLILV